MALETGSRLGPYEIVGFIGAGGMGEVYEGVDPRLDRRVAIKVLPASFAQDRDRLRRFEQEAKTAGALNHPNLVALYDIGLEQENPYIVMELLEGETLRQRLSAGVQPFRKTVEYALQIAHGIAAAHERGIIHRDLKPENIFLTRDGRLKILDFGLAKQAAETTGELASKLATQTGTAAGVVVGTAGYISPEQIRGLPADTRSDIFAFGAILFEMLSGKRAFHGDSPLETITQILTKDPLVETSAGNLSSPMHRILTRCLEKNPSERFQSIRDLAFSIEALSDGSGIQNVGREHGTHATPSFQRLTFQKGYVSSARFAPDGSTVIYSAAWNGEPLRVFMARPDALDSLPLPVPDADLLSVSPSGEMALLLNRQTEVGLAQQGILARAPMIGGTPRQLQKNISAADWMPDGKNLAIVRMEQNQNILEFPVGNEVYRTTGWIGKIRVSRSGRWIAFTDHPFYGDDDGTVAIVDTNGNKQTLTEPLSALQGIAWSPDDREVWFSAAERNTSERSLRAVTLDKNVRLVLRVPSWLILLDVSSSGKTLFARDGARREAHVIHKDESCLELSWLNWTFPRDLSTDGSQFLFIEQNVYGHNESCIRDTNGTPPILLGRYIGIEFSPDSNHVLASSGSPMRELRLLPVSVGDEQIIPMNGFECSSITFLDQETLLASGAYKDQPPSLHKLSRNQPPQPIGVQGPEIPTIWIQHSVSPDGKWMVGWDAKRMLRIYSLEKEESHSVPGVVTSELSIMWSTDSKKLFTYRPGSISATIFCVDLDSGERTVFKEIHPVDRAGIHGLGPIVLSADLETCIYSFRKSLAELYLADGLV